MVVYDKLNNKSVDAIKNGGLGIIPTDTIYGISASALDKPAVLRAYRLKGRADKKPMIVLISSLKDLADFGIYPNRAMQKFLNKNWPGPVSVVLDCRSKNFSYLHCGAKTIAFRLPKHPKLIRFIKKTGPIVSTSANLSGKPPALNILQAKNYFGDKVNFYVNSGTLRAKPSTVVRVAKNGDIKILRQGAVKIK